MKVSVIIPVYNVEEYLMDCLKSVENQTFKDFETVLIDDGSTDKSGELCEEYRSKHSNVVVVHQENQGLSMARNNGVKVSKGEYITFIDSDDYISNEYLSNLVYQIDVTDADISVGRSLIVFETIKSKHTNEETSYKIYTTEEALVEMMYEKEFLCTACAKLYKRELIERHPYPKGALFEDLATSYKIFGEASKVSVGNRYIYFWRHRKESISKQKINGRHIQSLKFAQDQIDYMKHYFPNAVRAAKYKYVAKIVSLVTYTFSGGDESKLFFHMLKEENERYRKEVLKDKEARFDIKIRCSVIRLGYYPAKIVIQTIEWIKPFRSKILLRKKGLI